MQSKHIRDGNEWQKSYTPYHYELFFLSVFRCSSHLHTCSSACHLFNNFVQFQNLRNCTYACTYEKYQNQLRKDGRIYAN